MARRKASHRTPRALLAQHTALAVSPVPSGAGFFVSVQAAKPPLQQQGRAAAQGAPIKQRRALQ